MKQILKCHQADVLAVVLISVVFLAFILQANFFFEALLQFTNNISGSIANSGKYILDVAPR